MSGTKEVFVCTNIDCRNRGSDAVLAELSAKLQAAKSAWVAKPYLCFSACNSGPNVVIAEKRCWLSGVKPQDIDQVIAFLNGGPELPHLKVKNDEELEEMIFAIIEAGLIPEVK
jgi:NADH:ubiquinone oxidoreductase subunit E